MFYSEMDNPDPSTQLNEPMPRAWASSGVIESVKTAVVGAIVEGLRGTTLSATDGENTKFDVSIEYPTDITSYPGIWVQFALTNATTAGLGMQTWTQDSAGSWGPINTYSFDGRITLTIAALSSKDRDRLADVVFSQLAFARAPDLVIRDPSKAAEQNKGLIASLNRNRYVSITLNTDQVQPGGQTVTSGVPWAPNVLLYEDNYSIGCHGQVNLRFNYEGLYTLAEIVPNPTINPDEPLYDPTRWLGRPPTPPVM
jgi:hypothetical protein